MEEQRFIVTKNCQGKQNIEVFESKMIQQYEKIPFFEYSSHSIQLSNSAILTLKQENIGNLHETGKKIVIVVNIEYRQALNHSNHELWESM